MAGEGDYKPPKGHDRHLNDSERAHSGAVGAKVRHGADALGKLRPRKISTIMKDKTDWQGISETARGNPEYDS